VTVQTRFLLLALAALRPRVARALLAVLGAGGAALLVLVLLGARRSLETGVQAVAGSPAVDLWLAPKGTDNIVRASGSLADEDTGRAAAVPGVAHADPVTRGFVTVATLSPATPRRLTLLALGVRGPDGLGGPLRLVSGRRPAGPDEITLDRAAAYRLGVHVGSRLTVADRDAVVVGLTRDTNLLATQLLFFDLSPEEGLLPVSYVAVRLAPHADRRAVIRQLERAVPRATVLPREAFVAASLREVSSGFAPLLLLVSSMGLVVAAVLVALLLQGLVEDRRGDVAVLRAMGAPAGALCLVVAFHAVALAAAGALAGGALAPLLSAALERLAPTVELAPRIADAAAVVLLFVLAGVAGSFGPLARLFSVEPLEAFRP
jgi:putative ABC transport system permease protein